MCPYVGNTQKGTWIDTHRGAHTHTFTYRRTYRHTETYTETHTRRCIHTQNTHIHRHTYTHRIHIYTGIHTHTEVHLQEATRARARAHTHSTCPLGRTRMVGVWAAPSPSSEIDDFQDLPEPCFLPDLEASQRLLGPTSHSTPSDFPGSPQGARHPALSWHTGSLDRHLSAFAGMCYPSAISSGSILLCTHIKLQYRR